MTRDDRWQVFQNIPEDFESFCKDYLPEIYLKPSVNEDVRKTFQIIRKLMEFSYFEYEFYDVAASKSMLTAEMAMKKRYLEVTNEEWKGPLFKLIDWLHKNHYFDVYNDSFLDHFRHIRNSMAHIMNYSFAGPMMKQWILHPVDLINDMYEDPALREQRIQLTNLIHDVLDEILPNGAELTIGNEKFILFHAWPSFINNKMQPLEINFYFHFIFEILPDMISSKIFVPAPGAQLTCNQVEINGAEIRGRLLTGETVFELTPINKKVNQDKFDLWLRQYKIYDHEVFHKHRIIDQMTNIITNQRRSFHKMN